MAFPQVLSVAMYASASITGSHPINLPNPTNAGELLLALVGDSAGATAFGMSGWTLVAGNLPASSVSSAIFAKISNGAEGATKNVTLSAPWAIVAQVYRISDWWGDIAAGIAASVRVIGNSATPNPGACTPAWGAADTLWLAEHVFDTDADSVSGPTNYSTPTHAKQSTGAAALRCACGIAYRLLNAASEDPGVFTVSLPDDWDAWTIAIRPATSFAPRIDVVANASTRASTEWLAGFSTLPEPPTPASGSDLIRFIR